MKHLTCARLAFGLLLSGTVYGNPEDATTIAPQGESIHNLKSIDFEAKRKSILFGLTKSEMGLEEKICLMERVIATMHFVLDSSYQNEAAQENSEKSILEAVIQCNNGKLKSLKQELHTQRELNSKIRDNIDSFVRVSSKVGKAMAERDE